MNELKNEIVFKKFQKIFKIIFEAASAGRQVFGAFLFYFFSNSIFLHFKNFDS